MTKLFFGLRFPIAIISLFVVNSCINSVNREEKVVPVETNNEQTNAIQIQSERLKKKWHEELMETALELNKELSKQKKKQMDEKTLNEFADCMFIEIEKKYPDIEKLLKKKNEQDEQLVKDFIKIMGGCVETVVNPYIISHQ